MQFRDLRCTQSSTYAPRPGGTEEATCVRAATVSCLYSALCGRRTRSKTTLLAALARASCRAASHGATRVCLAWCRSPTRSSEHIALVGAATTTSCRMIAPGRRHTLLMRSLECSDAAVKLLLGGAAAQSVAGGACQDATSLAHEQCMHSSTELCEAWRPLRGIRVQQRTVGPNTH